MLYTLLARHPIIPVVTLNHADDALPLCDALMEGGIFVIEITLRTEAGLDAIHQVVRQRTEMMVGAGTVSTKEQFRMASDTGTQFIVSPGLTPVLAQAAHIDKIPFLPGVATITEIMIAREHGFHTLKFFPAALAGGTAAIKQFSSLFSDVHFCPTGGVNLSNVKEYLSLESVICVGGSWITPENLIAKKDWKAIAKLAKEAMATVS